MKSLLPGRSSPNYTSTVILVFQPLKQWEINFYCLLATSLSYFAIVVQANQHTLWEVLATMFSFWSLLTFVSTLKLGVSSDAPQSITLLLIPSTNPRASIILVLKLSSPWQHQLFSGWERKRFPSTLLGLISDPGQECFILLDFYHVYAVSNLLIALFLSFLSYLFLSWKWVGFLRNQIQRQLSKTLTRNWHSKSPFFNPNTQPTFLNSSTDGRLCSRKVCFPSYMVYYVNTTVLP